MDLSINKLNLENNINFKGIEGAYNKQSTPVFKFYAPAHNKDEKVYLEFAPAQKDPQTAEYSVGELRRYIEFPSNDVLELPQETARKLSSGFAYRYRIVDVNGKLKRNEIDSFVESCKTRVPNQSYIDKAVLTSKIMDGIYRSSNIHQEVKIYENAYGEE